MSNIIKLIISVLICEGAGLLGSIFTSPSIATWYKTIKRPSFNPPNWIFAPVWTILFLLMGIALFLVWNKLSANANAKKAMIIFFVQLAFNVLWSIVFFGLKSPLGGAIVIVVLWILILMTIIQFLKVLPIAGWLLIPYILWVSFASILTFSIWLLNR